LTESVVALLFSPEEILQEESVRVVSGPGSNLYKSISPRLPDSYRDRLGKIAEGKVPREEFLFEKTRFLSGCFLSVPQEELLTLAASVKYFGDFSSLSANLKDNTLIWTLSDDSDAGKVHIHYEGRLTENEVNKAMTRDIAYYTLTMAAAEDFNYQYPDYSFEIYNYINSHEVKV